MLVVTDKLDENLLLSSRNLPDVLVLETREVDPVSLVRFNHVLLTKGAVAQARGAARMSAAKKYNPERLMTVLLAPVVSEKGTFIADKHEQSSSASQRRDEARDQGCGRADVQGPGRVGADRQRQGQGEALRPHHRPAAQLEEGLRVPEAGPGNQLRGGGLNHGTRQSQTHVRRAAASLVKVVNASLHKGPPVASLVESQKRGSGRNNNGHITMRHKGGGHKQHYRIVDFKRNKDGIPAKVERLEYDPNRSANIALLLYADGERRYIIAPRGVAVGMQLMSGAEAPIKPGNALPLRNIPVGTTIHCIEMQPGKGAQMARSAGAGVQLLAREGVYAQLRLRSGEIRNVHVDCRATIGEVGNEEHSLRSIGKAGASAGAASVRRCAASR